MNETNWVLKWRVLNSYGTFAQHDDDLDSAEAFHAEAAQLALRAGDDPLYFAHSLTSLSNVYIRQDRVPDALTCLKEALQIRRANLPDWHPHNAEVLHLMACAHMAVGDYLEARRLFAEAIRALFILPDDHPFKLRIAKNLLACQEAINRASG